MLSYIKNKPGGLGCGFRQDGYSSGHAGPVIWESEFFFSLRIIILLLNNNNITVKTAVKMVVDMVYPYENYTKMSGLEGIEPPVTSI